MYVLQLKGDELRSCLSSNQLSSFVQCSSPFEIQIFLEYNCCFQRGIQGDSEQFSICVLKYFLISPFWFFISYSSEFSEISWIWRFQVYRRWKVFSCDKPDSIRRNCQRLSKSLNWIHQKRLPRKRGSLFWFKIKKQAINLLKFDLLWDVLESPKGMPMAEPTLPAKRHL